MQHGWPALYVLLLWWFSTGVILYLNGLPRATHKWTMFWATVLLGVQQTSALDGITRAYEEAKLAAELRLPVEEGRVVAEVGEALALEVVLDAVDRAERGPGEFAQGVRGRGYSTPMMYG